MSKIAEQRAVEAYPYFTAENHGDVVKARRSFKKGYEQAEKDFGWVSVKDRLPEKPGRYYTATKYEEYGIHSFVVNNWFDDEGYIVVVDYWMPIPELPKEK